MTKTYKIRYNTKSKEYLSRWILVCEGREVFVSEIHINTKTFTTKDYIEVLGDYKCHISCTGNLSIKNNVAYITNNDEGLAIKRHILKTISYRLLSTSAMIITTYLLGVDIEISALIGIGELMFKPFLYFIHERIWYNLRFKKK
jgi:uncharacterized membrane protein